MGIESMKTRLAIEWRKVMYCVGTVWNSIRKGVQCGKALDFGVVDSSIPVGIWAAQVDQ
jgi:hypothetical protein